jgi:HD-GYP domain-containing protein (c-di-GMP phosphodiesterase class II)
MGMRLALPVFNPTAPGKVLLKPGYRLDIATINRLRDFKINDVWIQFPGLEAVDRFIKPEIIHHKRKLVGAISDAFQTASDAAAPRLDFPAYVKTVRGLVNELLTNPAAALFLDEFGDSTAPIQHHCMRVAYVSILLGLKLDAYLVQKRKRLDPIRAQEVTSLGVGAMLHDVGVARLPLEVFERFVETGDSDDPAWQEHTRLGYELVGESIAPSARAVILHHHQRMDGSGFPAQEDLNGEMTAPTGDQIHVFARIAAVANEYDKLLHPMHQQPVPPVVALNRLLQPEQYDLFDTTVLEALIKIAPPYPPGTIVTLSDGRRGAAMEHNPLDPCRPTVQILSRDDQAPLNFNDLDESAIEVIDLSLSPHIQIVKVGEVPVAEHNFELPRLAVA